jgi:hypothetical protein
MRSTKMQAKHLDPPTNDTCRNQVERQRNYVMNPAINTAFILRLTWDNESRNWLVLLKPTNGGKVRVFVDLELAFLFVAQHYTDK